MQREKDNEIILLGSTGSIGKQTLDVAERLGMRVSALCAGRDDKTLEEQVRRFRPAYCALADESAAASLRTRLADTDTKVLSGESGILEMINTAPAYTVVNAVIGKAGLLPTIESIKCHPRLALSNKESLVIAGDIVMKAAKEYGCDLIPVDSEHSAIYKLLVAHGERSDIKRLILTASGGPFFGFDKEALAAVTPQSALNHPTWSMGAKITIDSATMMNKGFEVIEASHLFALPGDKIDVLIHRQSIIHSMVEYIDNTVFAEMSVPDMRLCISYALAGGEYHDIGASPFDFKNALTFDEPDGDNFPLLPLAYKALSEGGIMPCVLNAANEVAVDAFLSGKLSFTGISSTVADVYESTINKKSPSLADLLDADRAARESTEARI